MLESDDSDFIKEREIEFIKLYGRLDMGIGTLANLTDGGEGIMNASAETRSKISKALSGIIRSDETRQKIREKRKTQKKTVYTYEIRKRFSESKRGDKNGMYGKHGTDNPKSKVVYQYDLNRNLVNEWVNAREAHASTGINYKHISACATGRIKSSNGFIWSYHKL